MIRYADTLLHFLHTSIFHAASFSGFVTLAVDYVTLIRYLFHMAVTFTLFSLSAYAVTALDAVLTPHADDERQKRRCYIQCHAVIAYIFH